MVFLPHANVVAFYAKVRHSKQFLVFKVWAEHVWNTHCQVTFNSCGTVDPNDLCPCLSNTFRVKRSPKKSPLSDLSPVGSPFLVQPPLLSLDGLTPAATHVSSLQDSALADESASHSQDDHATDEEKLASSTGHKWAALQDVDTELDSDQQDFPQPCDLTSFVNENSLPPQAPGEAPHVLYAWLACENFSGEIQILNLFIEHEYWFLLWRVYNCAIPVPHCSLTSTAAASSQWLHGKKIHIQLHLGHTRTSKHSQHTALASDPASPLQRKHTFILKSPSKFGSHLFLSVQDYEIEYMEKIGSSSPVSIFILFTQSYVQILFTHSFRASAINLYSKLALGR